MKLSRQKHPIRFYLLGISVVLLGLAAALSYWAPSYIERSLNRQDFGTLFSDATGGTFKSGPLQFHFWPTPHIVVPDGQVTIPKRLRGHWDTARIYPNYSALLRGKIAAGRVVLEKPDLAAQLVPDARQSSPNSPLPTVGNTLRQHLHEWLARAASRAPDMKIAIHEGRLDVTGLFEPALRLTAFDLAFQRTSHRLAVEARCRSNFWKVLHLSGSLEPDSLQGDLQIVLQQFDPVLIDKELPGGVVSWKNSPINLQVNAVLTGRQHAAAHVTADIPMLKLQGHSGATTAQNLHLEADLAYSPRTFQIGSAELRVQEPSLNLSGKAAVDLDAPLFEVELSGRQLGIASLREAALTLAGDTPLISEIFDVLRGGNAPWIRFSTRGPTARDLLSFRNMMISGLIEKGRLFIPGADLDLNDVRGKAAITHGVLEGHDLQAAYGGTKGRNGRLWLDFGVDRALPFYLEIDVEADLAPLPSLLEKWVEDPQFKGEMRRIRNVTGTAAGMLIVDGRAAGIDVTVDATQCRFEADYDRLPGMLSVKKGIVQYTRDQIQVVGLQGAIGTSTIEALTAHIAFGDMPLLQIDKGAARLDLDQVADWLDRYDAFEALPFRVQSDSGWLKLAQVALEGPLQHPSRWRFSAQGTAEGVTVFSPRLPGPAAIVSAVFNAHPNNLEIPMARLKLADTDLALENARFRYKDQGLTAAAMTIDGTIGEAAGEWIAERINFQQPWRLRTPVAVSKAVLEWSVEGNKAFRGDLTTGGGTLLKLELTMQGDRLQRQSVTIEDPDSHAELDLVFRPESLEVDFEGRFASDTLARMLQAEEQHSGYMEGRFHARIFPEHPGRSSVTGVLKAHDIHQPLSIPQRHRVEDLYLEAHDNRLRIQPVVIVIEGQTHRLSGTVDIEDEGYVLDLLHEATDITLSLPQSPASDSPSAKPKTLTFTNLPLQGRIISRIDSLTLGDFQWTPFKAVTRIKDGDWDCRFEEATLCGIETPGSVRIGPDNLSLSLKPATQDGNFAESMTCLLKKPDLIDGQFDLAGSLRSQGSYEDLAHAIDGEMILKARKGRIYRFNLLSKVLAVINLTEVFRGKMPDLMKDGLAYESIAVRVVIEDSLCTIHEAVIDGASANIAGQGTIDLATGETDMIVLVAPFKTVDALVRYTPLLGDWLGGTLISIPVKVTGPFSDPSVTPLAPSAVGSSLMNLMKKTINLPVQIVAPLWENEDVPSP